jgi:hypothetical protein
LIEAFNVQGQGGWLSDPQALQEARDKLDEVKAIKQARRTLDEVKALEEARRQPIETETSDADLVAEPAPQPEPEPEPSPQSPTHAVPVERWRDKHPVEPSRRQTILAQSRRMGRSDGDGKGPF